MPFHRADLSSVMLRLSLVAILASAVLAASGQTADPSPIPRTDHVELEPTPSPTPTPGSSDAKTATADPDAKPRRQRRGTFVPAPIPIVSPAFGSGMVLGLGYIFQLKENDTVSPPSTIGAVGAFTNNGTRGFGVGGRLYFGKNKYQASFAVGRGRAVYDFYGFGLRPGMPDISVELRQSGGVLFGEFMLNVGKNMFIGPRYQYRKLTVQLGGQQTPGGIEIPVIDLVSKTASIGFHVQRDLRDSTFYPTKGSLWDVRVDFFAKPIGSNRTYQTFKAAYNGYHTVGKGQIIAYRGSACSVSDRAPFFDLCLYGSSSDLRGYTTGQFQNRRMFATQIEYRRELKWRLGLVGFAGFGGVARHWNEFNFKDLLPAAGAGLRIKLDKKNHINYRIDWGYGRAGHTLSMSVTEAF